MIDIDTTELAVGAWRRGDFGAAERLCRRALDHRRDDPDFLLLLGLSLQSQSRYTEAVPIYRRLTELDCGNSLHWSNYASALLADEKPEAAESALEKALQLAPGDPDLLDRLGVLQLQLDRPLEARKTLLEALRVTPDSPVARIHAARACAKCFDYRAEQLLLPWREWLPLEDALQYELADIQLQSADPEAARILLEDLLQRTPSQFSAKLLLASVYERINDTQRAKSLLERVEREHAAELDDRRRKDIARQRSKLALRDRNFEAARRLLEEAGPHGADDYAHFFAEAEVCDKLGDPHAAMEALGRAHYIQEQQLRRAAPQRFESDAPILPAAAERVSAGEFARWPALKAPDAKDSPIFIVGFPRSGTTLLEQMLDSHPSLQSMDERPFFNVLASKLEDAGICFPKDLGKLDQRDCDELRKGYLSLACSKVPRSWNAQLVDKNPLNMLWLPMIHRLFPKAKFIFALRHPCDVILSCYMQNFRAPVLATASTNLVRLARAYVIAMECWLHHAAVFKPDAYVSRYEELVADTPARLQQIAEFLEVGRAEKMLDFDRRAREKGFIATPSYTQVIEPINRRGLGRWHRYREYFEPALPILKPMLQYWGYSAEAG